MVPANRQITIRDLLTHTAGIGYGGGPGAARWAEAGIQGWYFAHRQKPIRDTVRRMAELPMEAQPGERFVYGYNTDILGALIEVVSGRPLDEFLQQEIFDPLNMPDTHFYLPAEKQDRLAVVYSVAADGALQRTPDVSAMVGQGAYVDGPRVSFSGGAGLLSTVRDYARFLQMTANGGALDGRQILSRKTLQLMTVDHLNRIEFTPGSGFGLGFSVVKDLGARGTLGSVGEYAWGGAYHTSYWVDPAEQLVVVYMTQTLPAQDLDDVAKLRALPILIDRININISNRYRVFLMVDSNTNCLKTRSADSWSLRAGRCPHPERNGNHRDGRGALQVSATNSAIATGF